jgi:Zn-dependent protease with chaperone function
MPSHAESSLEAGLVALKQGNYHTAITQLEPVATNPDKGNASLQAQVGLVMAYARSGQVPKAIALCENLTQSHNSQVQDWATRALEHLTTSKKRGKESKKVAAGFVAVDHSRVDAPPSPQETVAETPSPQQPASELADTFRQSLVNTGSNLMVSGSGTKTEPLEIYWRQAKRAKVWQPLRKSNLIPSRLLAAGTFMALFWVLQEIVKFTMGLINQTLSALPYLEPWQLLYRDPTQVLLVILVTLIAVSPWLLDWLLTDFYSQQELPKEVLQNYSRETVRVLQRTCQQQHWPMPQLRILPIAAPMIFTYGNLTHTARITVSQGLLAELADDEIAAVYALCLGQIGQWDFLVMSLVMLVTLPIYRLHQQVSDWGSNITQPLWRWPMTFMASLTYGIWCLLTGTALLNSRLRLYDSDRRAAEITGNPNGLIRAFLKMAIGIADDIQKQTHTSQQLESLNLFTPIGYQQSLTLGSMAGYMAWEAYLLWEHVNPYRRWFTINNSHPLFGDRVARLCQIARHWHLETELHLTNEKSLKLQPQSFLLQIAPWLGIPLGLVFALLIWLVWQTAFTLHLLNLKWIYQDWSHVKGCLLIGFSIGTIIRINSLFPDIRPTSVETEASLSNLLANPSTLPVDSISVRMVGKLLGRRSTSNSLGQDLILQCNTGLVKLHHISWLGQSVNPQDWIGRQITVTGWFRRGATPWIDIQSLQTQNGKTIHSPHPIWSIILAVLAQAWGAYIFLKG